MESSLKAAMPARILIVDDDPMMRLLMHESLDNGSYDILEFSNGIDVLNDIQQQTPDMVLLDVKMPGMSGFEVCSQIRENYDDNSIAIVVVTGLDDSDSIEQAFNLGATAFISKPINPVTLPYRIQYLLQAKNAFAALKQREIYLEYMDRISRILTHNNSLETILQDTLEEMQHIFDADRVLILSSYNTQPYSMATVCETVSKQCIPLADDTNPFIESLSHNTFYRARNSEYPVICASSELKNCHIEQIDCSIKQLIIKALPLPDQQTWYIIMHQCSSSTVWTDTHLETFYRIALRLGSILSQHLLMQRLHESEALLRQAQHIGKLGNWTLNMVTGELNWSDEIYHIYGYEPGTQKPTPALFHERVVEEDLDRLHQFEQDAYYVESTSSIEYRIKLPDKNIRWIHKQSISKFDEKGHLVAVNGTVQDITERILKQEQEVHEHKMDAVGQLTSGVAHDFGNLMTIAKGNLDLIDDGFMQRYNIEDDDREIIDDARSAIYDGVALTRQLLAFSRKKSIAPEQLNIEQAISNFSHLFKKTLGDTIRLHIKIQPDLPDILVDANQFESSLLNAIINARDAMPRGGRLTIHAKLRHKSPRSLLLNTMSSPAQNYIRLTIADTGEGMDSHTLSRATEPFFTTKKNVGTGLGLSMIYGFMRQSGGILEIESRKNKGTCLLMYFPLCETSFVTGINESTSPQTAVTLNKALTVLVVEDREAVRRFAARCLQNTFSHILQAETADEAIQLLNKDKSIQLVFSDILMPGTMDGRDLAVWLKQNRPEVKVLLTTASERETDKMLTSTIAEFLLLPKPYTQQDLLKKINEMLSADPVQK